MQHFLAAFCLCLFPTARCILSINLKKESAVGIDLLRHFVFFWKQHFFACCPAGYISIIYSYVILNQPITFKVKHKLYNRQFCSNRLDRNWLFIMDEALLKFWLHGEWPQKLIYISYKFQKRRFLYRLFFSYLRFT